MRPTTRPTDEALAELGAILRGDPAIAEPSPPLPPTAAPTGMRGSHRPPPLPPAEEFSRWIAAELNGFDHFPNNHRR